MELSTDLEFLDERTYIHSSSLIECVYENCIDRVGFDRRKIVVDASFYQQVCHNGILIMQAERLKKGDRKYAAEFKLAAGTEASYVYFKEQDIPVRRRIKTRYSIVKLESTGEFSATCEISCATVREYIGNIVEANKRIHQAAFPGRDLKITNVYIKRIPFHLVGEKECVRLEIRNIGSREQVDGIITLNTFFIKGFAGSPFEMSFLVQWEKNEK